MLAFLFLRTRDWMNQQIKYISIITVPLVIAGLVLWYTPFPFNKSLAPCGPCPGAPSLFAKSGPGAHIGQLKGKDNIIPIAIIGSGPAGLSAAVYGARELPTMVFLGDDPGGLLAQTTEVENWPGERLILGPNLIANLQHQAGALGAQFIEDVVERVDFSQWPFVLYTREGRAINALSVIIATGGKPKSLDIPGEKEYWGRGVTACAKCDGPFFKGEDVVVVGGGDSAVEEALQLARHAKTITILVRKGKMRAKTAMQDRIAGYDNIAIRYNVEPRAIVGDGKQVTGIELFDVEKGKTFQMPIAGVFIAIGHIPNTAIFGDQLALDAGGYIVLDGRSQRTSVEGVFAAGDVEDSVYRQAGVASGSGIKAALDALNFLREVGFDTAASKQIESHLFRVPGEQPKHEPVKKQESLKQVETPTRAKKQSTAVQEVRSIAELDQLIKTNEMPVVIDFYGDQCPACVRMAPVYEQVANQWGDRAVFVKVNTTQVRGLSKYEIQRIPTFLIYQGGAFIARTTGAMGKREFAEFLEQAGI